MYGRRLTAPAALAQSDVADYTQSIDVCGSDFRDIPRTIHQTWKTAEIPECWRDFHDSWQRHHPTWEIRVWTDSDNRKLIVDHHPWFLATYDGFARDIQRVDAAKYFILYTHGGVYVDLDCECLAPIDDLVEKGGAVFGRTADRVIECAFMASSPGHPIWRLAFNELEHPSFIARTLRALPHCIGRYGFDAAHVLFHTGPQMMRRVVYNHCRKSQDGGAGVTTLPSQYLSDRSWWDRHSLQDQATGYVLHHYSNSWIEAGEGKFLHRVTRTYLIRVVAGCIGLIMVTAVAVSLLISL